MSRTTWIENSSGELVPTVTCESCGKRIDERTALIGRDPAARYDVHLCDTWTCWRAWISRRPV